MTTVLYRYCTGKVKQIENVYLVFLGFGLSIIFSILLYGIATKDLHFAFHEIGYSRKGYFFPYIDLGAILVLLGIYFLLKIKFFGLTSFNILVKNKILAILTLLEIVVVGIVGNAISDIILQLI